MSVTAVGTSAGTLVVHAQWSAGRVHLWGERAAGEPATAGAHPGAVEPLALWGELEKAFGAAGAALGLKTPETGTLKLRLPSVGGVPVASPHVSHTLATPGEMLDAEAPEDENPESILSVPAQLADESAAARETEAEQTAEAGVAGAREIEAAAERPVLGAFDVPTLMINASDAPALLDTLEGVLSESQDGGAQGDGSAARGAVLIAGSTLVFFAAAARFVRHLLAQQRFVPNLQQEPSGGLSGVWQAWLGDEATAARLRSVLGAMPPAARCVVDSFNHDAWAVLDDFVLRTGDAVCRRVLVSDAMREAVDGRDPSTDLHVAWLTGLLGAENQVESGPGARNELIKGVRRWIGGLEERGSGGAWRLLLRLGEPVDMTGLKDFQTPGEGVRWTLGLHLQSVLAPETVVDASDIWVLPPGAASVEGQRIESPQELLLSELGRAARVYKRLEKALEDTEPRELELSTAEAYKFLREFRPLLIEQGVGVEAPEWWDSPTVRLGARLVVTSEDVDLSMIGAAAGAGGAGASVAHLGLSSLVSYRWQIAVGEVNLTLEQFEKLAGQHSPLVRVNGKWVEIRPEDVKAAVKFIRENPGGQMEVGKALRLAYASEARETGVPVLGMTATGWVATVFGDANQNDRMPMLEAPSGFVGTLRAYQLKGLSWLAFLDKLGLGACLADDMGLGKTVQLLALLAHERKLVREYEQAKAQQANQQATPQGVSDSAGALPAAPIRPAPTLLIVPMSVVGNWVHEAKRFTPDLKVMVHHGVTRQIGTSLVQEASASDVVVTTYALAHRDREHLSQVTWGRVVLDEAQNIKNPGAKQTRAIHSIPAPRRIALTGTPLENRLIELWSIMDFLNPSYLGPASEFKSRFAVPIERYHDRHKGSQLRGLVQPFVLRRLKTDPTVITDLPEKVESKEYCYLTPEQATLYQACVSDMLQAAERAEGIQRRGVVLAGLIKLKQICNHPAHFLKESGVEGGGVAQAPARSGKCQRLVEMLQEVSLAGDKALVFTQFRQMGHLLAGMVRQALDRDVLFLHGGTPAAQRQSIIAEFQGEKTGRLGPRARDRSAAPVLILSLKAGGVGLNLTAANHVFHFDRWWNPAVESQATDRAYRIGQTRTVQVHKFVVSGTLEERIDQMIEEKTELADQIIGHGEAWLTEMSTSQLRDLLTLRSEAVGAVAGADEVEV